MYPSKYPYYPPTRGPYYFWQRSECRGWITDTPESMFGFIPKGTTIIAKVQNIGDWPTFDANGRLLAGSWRLLQAAEAILALIGDGDLPDNGELSGAAICDQLKYAVAEIKGGSR
ncbi:MAG: hypothetical protein PHV74_09325 [Dehalococcoidia bacterium]|nr:hypothetical protein [Dehalococcoidia bacterium]